MTPQTQVLIGRAHRRELRSLQPGHTASGANTTYTAPSAPVSAVITATATSSSTATATANVSVVAASSSTLSSGSFGFYVAGEDSKKNTYAIGGSVVLDATGKVTGGEQDYVSVGGAVSPEPGGDQITGGQLTSGSNGIATLTVVTNNSAVGVSGTETFTVSVVNTKHAAISEFDASATSSGSLDFQTLSPGGLAEINGPFVFVVAGKDGSTNEQFGGLLTGDGAGGLHVTVDSNEGGTVTRDGTNTGTYTAPDASGRGTMAFGGNQIAYYVVSAKVFRMVVLNTGEPDVGSAYAGVSGASNASLNTSFVFTDASTFSSGALYAAAGKMTMNGNGAVTGFADVDENGQATSAAITGTYSVASNGYSTITITPGNTQDISVLGLYLTDPTINFSDPNSPADAGLCGLLIDLDTKVSGSGLLILPGQSITPFTGNFALNGQSSISGNELDVIGVTAVTGTSISGTENLNDLFNTGQDSGVSLSGTLVPDTVNSGRYTIPLAVNIGATPSTLHYVLYQASNTQVVVLEVDTSEFGLGMLQKQQ